MDNSKLKDYKNFDNTELKTVQKVVKYSISSYGSSSIESVNEEILNGWKVISITPVSISSTSSQYSSSSNNYGPIIVLYEREEEIKIE